MKTFAILAAALVVLTGFAVAVLAEPMAVTAPPAVGTESGSQVAFGGDAPTATEGLGGDATQQPALPHLVVEITAAGDTAAFIAFVEFAADSHLIVEFAPTAEYSPHDALGRRVRVEGPTPSTWTAAIQVGGTVVFERDQSDHTTKYVYAAGFRVARIDCTPVPGPDPLLCETQYYLADHLGSTRKVLDADSPPHVTFTAEYTPFGEAYNVAGSERFRFTGEQFDDPTGFTHLRARQYDPGTGRFTGADPVLGSLSHPQTQNRYAYVSNRPTGTTDPSGMCELS